MIIETPGFAGFNNDISAVVWVGNDNNQPLGIGEQGSRTALPNMD